MKQLNKLLIGIVILIAVVGGVLIYHETTGQVVKDVDDDAIEWSALSEIARQEGYTSYLTEELRTQWLEQELQQRHPEVYHEYQLLSDEQKVQITDYLIYQLIGEDLQEEEE